MYCANFEPLCVILTQGGTETNFPPATVGARASVPHASTPTPTRHTVAFHAICCPCEAQGADGTGLWIPQAMCDSGILTP